MKEDATIAFIRHSGEALNVEHFGEFWTSLIDYLTEDNLQDAYFVMDYVRFHWTDEIQ